MSLFHSSLESFVLNVAKSVLKINHNRKVIQWDEEFAKILK